jgi:hypothetical protein
MHHQHLVRAGGGIMTGRARQSSSSIPAPAATAEPRCHLVYEVDAADGHCLYRGEDLGLADEVCGSEPGTHLLMLPATRPVGTSEGAR